MPSCWTRMPAADIISSGMANMTLCDQSARTVHFLPGFWSITLQLGQISSSSQKNFDECTDQRHIRPEFQSVSSVAALFLWHWHSSHGMKAVKQWARKMNRTNNISRRFPHLHSPIRVAIGPQGVLLQRTFGGYLGSFSPDPTKGGGVIGI